MYHDRKTNLLKMKIGDNVFLLKGGKIKKLNNQYTAKGKPTVVHVNRLKRSHIYLYLWTLHKTKAFGITKPGNVSKKEFCVILF